LLGRHGGAHEGHNIVEAGLVEAEDIEEAFNQDEVAGLASGQEVLGAMEVEEDVALFEIRGELIFRIVLGCLLDGSTGIGDEPAAFIVDGDGDTVGHHALGAEAQAEVLDGLLGDASRIEVGVIRIEGTELEGQGRVDPGASGRLLFCRLLLLLSPGSFFGLTEMEPVEKELAGFFEAHILFEHYEVEDVAAPGAVTEAVPDVFFQIGAELSGIGSVMERAGSDQAGPLFLEACEPIVGEDHLHRDGALDELEIEPVFSSFHGEVPPF